MSTRLYTPESNALAKICREWYVMFGVLTLIVVVSFYISPLWMPLVEEVLAILLAFVGTGNRVSADRPCGRLTLIAIMTLVLTGLVSFGINVAYKTEFVHHFFDIETLNTSIPYITSLVIFPICAVVTGVTLIPAAYQRHIRHCHLHNTYNPSHPMLGRIVHATYRSLSMKLLCIVAIISIIDWVYYFIGYNNHSINTPDRFFFFVIPAAIYVWSIIYVRHAYSSLMLTNGRIIEAINSDAQSTGAAITDSAVVRFLIIHHDCLLLDMTESAVADCAVDTTYTQVKPHSFNGNVESVRSDFEHLTGIKDLSIKRLYTSSSAVNHVVTYHYLIHIDDNVNIGSLHGTWVPLNSIDTMMKTGLLAPVLCDEIFRVYTVAMAWKTYHRDGRRRYAIRNYRPSFRLEDIHKWDVDYEDPQWLRVSKINQDSPFWFIKKYRLKS